MNPVHPGGDPRVGPPERTYGPGASPTTIADQLRADYQAWAQRTGRRRPRTSRVPADLAWRMIAAGHSTPQALGWPDTATIEAAVGYDGDHPDGAGHDKPVHPALRPGYEPADNALWTGPTTDGERA